MKRYQIIILLIITLIITSTIFFIQKSSYKNRIEEDFIIDTKGLKLKKKSEKEEWSPNGDGIKVITLNYENLNESIINLNKIPIKEDLPPNEIPKEFLLITEGYYKYIVDKNDNRNFRMLIIDTLKKQICVYYQIM